MKGHALALVVRESGICSGGGLPARIVSQQCDLCAGAPPGLFAGTVWGTTCPVCRIQQCVCTRSTSFSMVCRQFHNRPRPLKVFRGSPAYLNTTTAASDILKDLMRATPRNFSGCRIITSGAIWREQHQLSKVDLSPVALGSASKDTPHRCVSCSVTFTGVPSSMWLRWVKELT